MRTYTHGIIGYLLYKNKSKQEQTYAIIGAMVPDLILAIGFIFHFSSSKLFESLHHIFHSGIIHQITVIMHSATIVLPILIISFFYWKKITPFFVGMLSHIILDFFTHQAYEYNHFFPLPIEPIKGIFSYTSLWFTIIEHVLVIGFFVWLYINKKKKTSAKKKVSSRN